MFLSRYLKQYEKPVLFGIVILIAVTFGITSEIALVSDRATSEPVLSYFQTTMTAGEWQGFLWRWRVLFQFLSPGERFPEDQLENEARRLLIVLHEANAAGIHVSDGEVSHFIKTSMEASGRRFSRDGYLSSMNQRRVRPEEFEETVRDLIRIQKFTNSARNSSSVPLPKVFDEYVKLNEEVRANLVAFRAKDLGRQVREISGVEIARQFQSQKDQYGIPDRVQIAYAFAAHDALVAQAPEPTEEEQKKFYDEHKERWVIFEAFPSKQEEKKDDGKTVEPGKTEDKKDDGKSIEPGKTEDQKDDGKSVDKDGEPDGKETEPKKEEPKPDEPKYKPLEEVKAGIVKDLKQEAAEKLAIEKIEDLERLVDEARLRLDDKGVDLEGIAKKLGLVFDVTGFTSRKSLGPVVDTLGYSKKFGDSVFSMEEGEYSAPMSTEKGWFLFRLLRKLAAEPGRLTEDVRRLVIRDLQVKKGRDLAKTRAAAFQEAARTAIEKDLKEKLPAEVQDAGARAHLSLAISQEAFKRVAQEMKLKVEDTDWFKRDGWIPGLKTYSREIAEIASDQRLGDSNVISSYQDAFAAQTVARRPPDSTGFAQQRDFLRNQMTDADRKRYMRSWHEVLTERADLKMLDEKKHEGPPAEPGEEGAPPAEDHSGHDHGEDD